jgi:Neutral/alkaline non-lysosomal ceramidase, N-terminal
MSRCPHVAAIAASLATLGRRLLYGAAPFLFFCGPVAAGDFQAGVARVKITPPTPFWMSGYAARSHPSEGVEQDLWAKALALRDGHGGQVVLVTTDLIGLPRAISDEVASRVEAGLGVKRAQLVLSASHTHCGPAVRKNLAVLYDFDEESRRRVDGYGAELVDRLVEVVGAALHDLAPARLGVGHGSVEFAVNRREPTPDGVRIGVNPNGPVDHDVPVLRVTGKDGSLRAVLFGYACHNTTLGADFYRIGGDYAGYAQAEVERAHPKATALFVMLCGGDQNPRPRGALEDAMQHGHALADEVDRVLASKKLARVRPPVRTALETATLAFAPHTRATFEADLANADVFRQRRARLMLAAYDDGRPVHEVPYPVQAVRFGGDLTLVALGGEPVVDYALRAKRELKGEDLIVAGYCHDVMGYIPSRRVLREGGYEAVDNTVYYGLPGPFAESVEETVFAAMRRAVSAVGRRP